MGEWQSTTLGQVATISSGSSPPKPPGKFIVIGANGQIGSAPKSNFGPGYLVGRVGAVGVVTRVTHRCWASDNTLTVLPKPKIDESFLGYLLEFLNLGQLATKTAQPLITQTQLRRRLVSLPPVDEQQQIAVILTTIDEAIQATERIIAKRLMALTGLQIHLLGTTDGARTVMVCDLVMRHWPGEWGEEGPSGGSQEVTILRATNLNDYGIDYSTGARRFVAGAKVVDKQLIDGDLLVEAAGGGPGVPVGRVRRFRQPEDDKRYVTSNFFRALRPRTGVDSDYLFWLLDNEYQKPSIWSCQQQTTGIINLNVTDYLERPVSYHEASQLAIAQALNCALEAIEAERQVLQKLQKMRSGLAADLLSGRVRTVAA